MVGSAFRGTPLLDFVLMVSLMGGLWAQGVRRWVGQMRRADRQDCGLPFCAFLFRVATDAPILKSGSTIRKKSALFGTDIGHVEHIEGHSVSGFEHRPFTFRGIATRAVRTIEDVARWEGQSWKRVWHSHAHEVPTRTSDSELGARFPDREKNLRVAKVQLQRFSP